MPTKQSSDCPVGRATSGVLYLTFPWSSHPVAVHSPSDLSPRQYKYLQWCLDDSRTSRTRARRLLSLLGFQPYRWVVWLKMILKEKQKWHYPTGSKAA